MKPLYNITIEGLNKNRGLYRFCKSIPKRKQQSTLASYLDQIFEGRSGPGLYWLLPNKNNQYYLAFFPESQYGEINHDVLWNQHVAPLLASHFEINQDKLKDQYDSFPRGRLEIGETLGTWMIGCADEYPKEWDKDKLYKRLQILPQNTTYEVDEHWLTDKEKHQKIKELLGLSRQNH